MNQQLSALLGIRPVAQASTVTGANVASNDQSPSFASTLTDALGDVATPDAAMLALLADVTAVIPAAAALPALGAELGLALADDGNGSPENGNDLPLLQLLDPASLLSPPAGAVLDINANGATSTLPLPDPSLMLTESSAQPGLTAASIATQALAAEALADTSKPPATSGRATASAPTATAVAAANLLNIAVDEPGKVTVSAPAQSSAQDSSSQQRHNAPLNQEWLTTVASVLVPIKDGSVERFELTPPTAQAGVAPDTTLNLGGQLLSSGTNGAAPLTAAPVSASGKPELIIPQTPGQVGWSDVLAERVSFAVRQNFQEAEIRLNPPQLGQVDVRIVMNNDQANLMFSSPHGAVREAIELSIGRLREMLADSGFNLVNVDVSDKSLAQQRNDAREQRDSSRSGSQATYRADFEIAAHAPEVFRSGTGSVDYYV